MTPTDGRRDRRTLTSRRPLTAGLAAAGLVLAPGFVPVAGAQEGGLTATFSVDQSVRVTDNPGFVPDPDEGGVIGRTSLGFGLTSVTRAQTIDLSLGSYVEYGDTSGVDEGFQSPSVDFLYERESQTARFALDAGYSERDVRSSFALPFETGSGPIDDGADVDPDAPESGIEPDDDIGFDEQDIVVDDGTRQTLSLGTDLDLGVGTPTELSFGAEYRKRTYDGTDDPDLFDDERWEVGAGAELRINPAVTGLASADASYYDADDDEETERFGTSVGAGARLRASAALDVEALVSYDRVETTEDGDTDVEDGVGGTLGFTLARPRGEIGGEIDTEITGNGRRDTVRLSRSLELRDGSLSGSLGVTRFDDGEVRPVARLNFNRSLRDGSFNASLNQTAAIDDDDNNVIRTALGVGLSRDINAVSSINGRVNLAAVQVADDDGDDSLRAGLSLGYNRALTEDWSLSTGYQLDLTAGDDIDDRTSNTLFVSIGRDFTFRP